MGPGGALEAAIEAREQGLVRFIGVTGHGWTIAAMHRRSLARFDFDSVLLPYNFFMAQNERYRQAFEEVLAICRERNVAVQIIKSIARGPWATTDRTHTTWYQPLEEQADIDRAVHWVLGVPGRLPEHRRRPRPAAPGPRRRQPLRAPPAGRRRWRPCSTPRG